MSTEAEWNTDGMHMCFPCLVEYTNNAHTRAEGLVRQTQHVDAMQCDAMRCGAVRFNADLIHFGYPYIS